MATFHDAYYMYFFIFKGRMEFDLIICYIDVHHKQAIALLKID